MDRGGGKKKKGGFVKKKKKKGKEKDDRILDESVDVDMELATKSGKQKVKTELFKGVESEFSLYMFHKTNPIRIFGYKIATSNHFEHVVLALIILSSAKLIFDTYNFDRPPEDTISQISKNIDQFFTIFFTFESFVKALALGLIIDQGSYLRESWSQIDFFIVVTSIIDDSFDGVDLPIIKILRLLRTLRPLRFISHNSAMKTLVTALLESIGAIFNVAIVVMVVWLMFAILAVNLFGGKLQYCSGPDDLTFYRNATHCEEANPEYKWTTYSSNFDDVPTSMLTLFVISSLEGWPDIMFSCTDSFEIEEGPVENYSAWAAYFFIIFVFIGSFFFMNFFVGVLFLNFEEAQKEEKRSLFLKDEEIKWVDMMKMIVKSRPDLETTNVPVQSCRKKLHQLVTSDRFDAIIMTCIVLNLVQMALGYETQTQEYSDMLTYLNYFFTGVFGIECILKLVAFCGSYFKSGWNKFDFFVVIASFLDIAMNQLDANSLEFLRVGPQLARVLRVLRVSRLFRLLNKYKGLQALLQTITFSLPSLFNVFSLLLIIFFISAVLGCFLFRQVKGGDVIDDYVNFGNFGLSMLILLRVSTGEDWNVIMYDTMNEEIGGSRYASIFFIFFIMICSFVMLNLFVLVIIQQFEEYYLPDDNVLQRFKEDVMTFKEAWTVHTKEHNCLKIKDQKMIAFFKDMKPKLGMQGSTDREVMRNLVSMDLRADEEGFIYYNELLFKSMRRIYGPQGSVKNKILLQNEVTTLKRIEKIKQKMMKVSKFYERQTIAVNPFLSIMYFNMSWKVWNQITSKFYGFIFIEQMRPRRVQEDIFRQERYDTDTDEEEEKPQYIEQTINLVELDDDLVAPMQDISSDDELDFTYKKEMNKQRYERDEYTDGEESKSYQSNTLQSQRTIGPLLRPRQKFSSLNSLNSFQFSRKQTIRDEADKDQN